MNRWSRHYDQCRTCGTTERAYGGNGLCGRCYANELNRATKAGRPEFKAEFWSEFLKQLGREHPGAFRDLLSPETRARLK